MIAVWSYPAQNLKPNPVLRKMIFRFILNYLANNPQLINKLADSYPMRRVARWVVYAFHKGKAIAEKRDFNESNIENSLKKLKEKLEKELKK